jgi:plasmid stabilization system protein ParE
MNHYIIAPAATRDMEEIFLYIAQDNPDAAEKLEADFFSAFAMLAEHPNMGNARPEVTEKPFLFWPVRRRYCVIYKTTNPINILRVVNTYRDLAALLQDS